MKPGPESVIRQRILPVSALISIPTWPCRPRRGGRVESQIEQDLAHLFAVADRRG